MRHFVVLGRTAHASIGLRLDDIPSSGGRLDVLLRCARAALLVSHGLRRDVVVYLVLAGEAAAPRTLRIDGASAKFIRPDERSLGATVQKALARAPAPDRAFTPVKPGLAVSAGGLDAVLADLTTALASVLDENGSDIRQSSFECAEGDDVVFFVGDHLGFDEGARAELERIGARSLALGPVSLHAEDAITVVSNEMDRRAHGGSLVGDARNQRA
jgi:tRNA (pseudouridine54-N1)-methyltransferase